ncbi:MAG: exo-alpha-sialidase [Ruminococcaceae bacterium]|nr:exo-alpha-sialidase [Oscillospiraceae bacterium]
MRGIDHWQFAPYRPYHQQEEACMPFICRLAPGHDSIELEWFDRGDAPDGHQLCWREREGKWPWRSCACTERVMQLKGLHEDCDYELQVLRRDGSGSSAVRLARTGTVPGQVVNYLHPQDPVYAFSGRALCSPSLLHLPGGALLASMDLFAPNGPQNLTILCRSDDDGLSWHYVTDLFPCYWGTLFWHRERLYMLACSTEYGDLLIGCSLDEGKTWTRPVHLLVGSSSAQAAGWQKTPVPMINHDGRIFMSIDYGAWQEGGHSIGLLSVPEDADLLDPLNWTCSELIAYDPAWPGAPQGKSSGLLEGNMVVAPDGRLLNILRVGLAGCQPSHGLAVALQADSRQVEAPLRFDRFVALPSGSNSKTHILFDEQSGQYIAIGNICVDEATPAQRNVLALQVSSDLENWRIVKLLLDYREDNPAETGFQYISFLFDGPDLCYLSRTALNGARNFHDANYITYHRVHNFRQLLDAPSRSCAEAENSESEQDNPDVTVERGSDGKTEA